MLDSDPLFFHIIYKSIKIMKIIFLFIALFIFKFSYSQNTIYYGNNGFYKVYFDDSKKMKIVEIYSIKFGYHDTINYTKSEHANISNLFTKNNKKRYIYKNNKLGLNILLTCKDYNKNKDDYRRNMIFNIMQSNYYKNMGMDSNLHNNKVTTDFQSYLKRK